MKSRRTSKSPEAVARAAQVARLAAISEGLQTEIVALNRAIRSGREVRFPVQDGSIASGKLVSGARYGYDGLWVECANYGGSFCLGNDGRWAELLTLAGVQRDPRAEGNV